ncbi:MAG: transporter [Verrucomicrobiales bacterium]|nr:transporter [Verrucomicrobiales bacterium]
MNTPTGTSTAAATPAVTDEFRYWQRRILITTLVGYAFFYLVRKNISFAMPGIKAQLGLTKADLGMFLTLHGVVYGVSKFVNGFVADRMNARWYMVTGLVLSAAMNVCFGFSSAVVTLGVFWVLNGWFQGMGFPPCARLMTHWFSPKELATKMSIWNTSHSFGAGAVAILAGYLAAYGWRYCFWVPGGLAILAAVVMAFRLRDTPQSVGLPELPDTRIADAGKEDTKDFKRFIWRQVLTNRGIWVFAIANFFVYVLRYSILDWGPTLLKETKGVELQESGWMIAAFEASGVVGMLLSGWITDKVFGGRGARTCVFCMFMASLSALAFWYAPSSTLVNAVLLGCAGFFIYGPQALVGICAANLATKKAAATAVGFTGVFGYLSTTLSGWGLGKLVDTFGWHAGFLAIIAFGLVGTALFALGWNLKPHGYATTSTH